MYNYVCFILCAGLNKRIKKIEARRETSDAKRGGFKAKIRVAGSPSLLVQPTGAPKWAVTQSAAVSPHESTTSTHTTPSIPGANNTPRIPGARSTLRTSPYTTPIMPHAATTPCRRSRVDRSRLPASARFSCSLGSFLASEPSSSDAPLSYSRTRVYTSSSGSEDTDDLYIITLNNNFNY